MKQPYNWDYTIRVKTKEGTFEYEDVPLEDIVLIDLKYPNREELQVTRKQKKLVKGVNNGRTIKKNN